MDYPALIISLFLAAGCAPLAFFWGACPCCATAVCNHCSGSAAKNTVQVDISGVANAGCLSCASLDGTYVLTEANLPHAGGSDACIWNFNIADVCTSPNDFTFCTLSVNGPAGAVPNCVSFNFTGSGLTTTWIGWTETGAGYDNCAGWSAFNLPYDGPNYMSGVACDNSAATCAITAL
jgi:hypothetical protein